MTLKNLPDAINNAYTTVDQTLYDNNPQGKRIKFSINVEGSYCSSDINVIAEDLLEEIFINLFSNSVKYTDSPEVRIDVLIRDYFIGEVCITEDYSKGTTFGMIFPAAEQRE